MGIVHSPKGWGSKKPPAGTQINFGHPLARGLVLCLPLNTSGPRPVDAITGGKLYTAYTVMEFADLWTAQEIKFLGVEGQSPGDIAMARCTATACGSLVYGLRRFSTGNVQFSKLGAFNDTSWYPYGGQGYFTEFRTATRITNVPLSATVDILKDHQLTLTSKPGANGYCVYQNQLLVGSYTGESAIGWQGYQAILYGYPNFVWSYFKYIYMYNRALDPNEVAQLYVSPYCFFRPQSPK